MNDIEQDQAPRDIPPEALAWTRTPGTPLASLVLAHGAGAPMDSPFMASIAERLAARGVEVCRFEFAYMAVRRQTGRKRPPEPQAALLSQWREVFAAVQPFARAPLAIGGKSMGGRMASLLADELQPAALVCLGYPFHPAGKPDRLRTAHLQALQTPTLIVQGERDALGNRQEVEGYDLPSTIELCWLEAADHDLAPLKRSGFERDGHLDRAADAIATYLRSRLG